jgi:hypothetical protein
MELQVIQANKTWDEVEKMKKDAQTEVDRLEINLLHEMDQLSSIQISDASYGDDRDWYTYTITPGGKLKEFRKLNLLKMQIESYLQAKSEEKLGKLAFPNMKLTCRSAVHEPMTNKKSESTTNQGLK